MENSATITLVVLASTIALLFVVHAIRTHNSAKEEAERKAEERRQATSQLNQIAPDIVGLHDAIAKLVAYESGYLMKKDWDSILDSASPVLTTLATIPEEVIAASACASQAAYVKDHCLNPSFRTERNNGYKTHELKLCDGLLSDIDGGKSLDDQQRDAVVTDEYSNLVIAGAGSGKTSIVVGKVKYLVERWGIDPSEILVTSFTRASVEDLKTRIESNGVRGVSARTFHSLGLRVLGSGYAVANENALTRHVSSYFSEELAANPLQAAAFLEFFGLWSLNQNEEPDAEESEVRMKLLKAQDMRTLKGFVEDSGRQPGMDTLLGERVKSLEELMIANFLFLNGVRYEYEGPYPYSIPQDLSEEGRRAYQPDFHLVDYDIWLEHFGIDENGRIPWMKTPVEEQAYIDGMNWKRRVHRACGTRLIESYSFWNKDQDLLNQLEQLLTANGVTLVNDPERNAAICGDLLRDQRFFGSMSQLVSTFISLVKSSNKTEAEVDEKAREAYRGHGALWHRYDLFTRFAWPILRSYQLSLTKGDRQLVDFDDMISKAAERIRLEGFKDKYRYIIVDEYQDISLSRLALLQAIRDSTGAKLMCVGDDWQAIYRFAGSDVTLFTNFGRFVGYHEKLRIERTYRNCQALVDVASKFVLKNPDQLRKSMRSMAADQHRPPIAVISMLDQRAALTFALNDLLAFDTGGEIKILGRNRRDLERIFPGLAPTEDFSFRDPRRNDPSEEKFDKVITYKPAGAAPRTIGYMTVHKSKGLQADNVIIIGLTNDRYGFPNMVSDDPILRLLLADSDRYEFAEERRLFYVALTRTKNKVWLVTGDDTGNPGSSRFVDEICKDAVDGAVVLYRQDQSEEPARCPRCGGVLLVRQGPNGVFVGCSNYPFCDKSYRDTRILVDKKKCPVCGGWLTRRHSSYGTGEFYGCTNYPDYCRYTLNIEYSSEGPGRHAEKGRDCLPDRGQNKDRQDIGPDNSPEAARLRFRPATSKNLGFSYAGRSSAQAGHPQADGQPPTPRCPKCGSPMKRRTNRYGQYFFGCSRFPQCRGTRNYPH